MTNGDDASVRFTMRDTQEYIPAIGKCDGTLPVLFRPHTSVHS